MRVRRLVERGAAVIIPAIDRRQDVRVLLADSGAHGMTTRELANVLDLGTQTIWYHLVALHRDGEAEPTLRRRACGRGAPGRVWVWCGGVP